MLFANLLSLTQSGHGLLCLAASYILVRGKLVVVKGHNAFLGSNIGEQVMIPVPSPNRRPLALYKLVLMMAIPISVLSLFVGVIGSLKVPITDLMLAFAPLTAALFLVFYAEGTERLVLFLKRVFDYRSLASNKCLFRALLLRQADTTQNFSRMT